MATCGAFVALSAFQVGAIVVMTLAAMLLAYLVGLAEGRAREAAEPTEHLIEDDGDGIGASGGRRRH